jgi:hypothetical protein
MENGIISALLSDLKILMTELGIIYSEFCLQLSLNIVAFNDASL